MRGTYGNRRILTLAYPRVRKDSHSLGRDLRLLNFFVGPFFQAVNESLIKSVSKHAPTGSTLAISLHFRFQMPVSLTRSRKVLQRSNGAGLSAEYPIQSTKNINGFR